MAVITQCITSNKLFFEKEEKIKEKRIKLLLCIGVIYVGFNFLNLVKQEFYLYRSKHVLEQQMQLVTKESDNLKQNIHYFKTDAGIEELARKNLGYVKTDEIPIKIIVHK